MNKILSIVKPTLNTETFEKRHQDIFMRYLAATEPGNERIEALFSIEDEDEHSSNTDSLALQETIEGLLDEKPMRIEELVHGTLGRIVIDIIGQYLNSHYKRTETMSPEHEKWLAELRADALESEYFSCIQRYGASLTSVQAYYDSLMQFIREQDNNLARLPTKKSKTSIEESSAKRQ